MKMVGEDKGVRSEVQGEFLVHIVKEVPLYDSSNFQKRQDSYFESSRKS